MFTNKGIMVMICIIYFIINPVGRADTFDFEEAYKIAKIGDELIQNAKGELIFHQNAIDTTTIQYNIINDLIKSNNPDEVNNKIKIRTQEQIKYVSYTYKRNGNLLKYSMEDKSRDRSYIKHEKCYDGEKTTMITYYTNKGLIVPVASINNRRFEDPYWTPLYFGHLLYGNDISLVLKNKEFMWANSHVENIKYIKTEFIDKNEADMFSGIIDNNVFINIWLAKKYLYRPIKIEIKDNRFAQNITIRYTKIQDEIYYPDKTKIIYSVYNDGKEHIASEIDIDYLLENTKVNIPITTNDFIINIPSGMKTYDTRLNDERKMK